MLNTLTREHNRQKSEMEELTIRSRKIYAWTKAIEIYYMYFYVQLFFTTTTNIPISRSSLLKCIARGGEKECKTKRLGNLL